MQYVSLAIWIVALLALVAWGQTFRNKSYDFVGQSKTFMVISLIAILLAAGSLVTRGLNWGLDFTGGTIIEAGAYQKVTPEQISAALDEYQGDLGSRAVQTGADMITDPTDGRAYQKVIVRITRPGGDQLSTEEAQQVLAFLGERLGEMKELRVASIGPTISGELAYSAGLALVLALVLQAIYIFVRFGNQMRFGVAADAALIHDVIIMVGFYSLAGREVDSPFVAALLTVVGYSVMDSVVIFDRIRETALVRRNVPFAKVVNESVNATMTRSINTTLTTVVALVAIYFFGGSTLQNFAFALLVGIISGAYSSICVAGPLLVAIDNYVGTQQTAARAIGSSSSEAALPADSSASEEELADESSSETVASGGTGRKRKRGKRRGS